MLPAAYFGKTTANKSALSLHRLTESVGGLTWATSPFCVSVAISDMKVSGNQPLTSEIELFFKHMGRTKGKTFPVSISSTAISSDSNRQPDNAKLAHKVLLPEPGGAGKLQLCHFFREQLREKLSIYDKSSQHTNSFPTRKVDRHGQMVEA